jgi:polysaccharide biosynthesis/export protein
MRPILFMIAIAAVACAQQPARTTSTSANLPAQPLGANDMVEGLVYNAPEFSGKIRVAADGTFRIPMLKGQPLAAAGLLPSELESRIAAALKNAEMLVDPLVTVTVAEYHSRPITIGGAVKQPITFQADGPTSLLDAMSRAGGLREDAGPDILVSRARAGTNAATVAPAVRISARGLYDGIDQALNITLAGGEEIRVPEAARIYIAGNVKKPGAIKMQDHAESSVFQVLAAVEGLAPFYSKTAYIYRSDAAGNQVEIEVPLDKILKRKAKDVPLVANDIFYVPDARGRRLTVAAIEKIVTFGINTGAAAIIYGMLYK